MLWFHWIRLGCSDVNAINTIKFCHIWSNQNLNEPTNKQTENCSKERCVSLLSNDCMVWHITWYSIGKHSLPATASVLSLAKSCWRARSRASSRSRASVRRFSFTCDNSFRFGKLPIVMIALCFSPSRLANAVPPLPLFYYVDSRHKHTQQKVRAKYALNSDVPLGTGILIIHR